MAVLLDLDTLRATIASAADEGASATVSKSWLKQVEREITEGRAAKALLAVHDNIALACAAIQDGCRA